MATKHHFTIDQGTTFEMTIGLNDDDGVELDTTGYEARSKFRKHHLSSNSVDFSTALSNGALVLSLTANQTSNVVAGRYVYDVELVTEEGIVLRILEGVVTLNPEVSR
jgi:hypothetical protein